MNRAEATCELRDVNKRTVARVRIYAAPKRPDSLILLSAEEAAEHSEERLQILEELRYEFIVEPPHLRLRESDVVERHPSEDLAQCGSLRPASYIGRLPLEAQDAEGHIVGSGAIEVRSDKIGYREDFRRMLADITEACLDLALDPRSPTDLRATPLPGETARTLYQQYAFVRGLLGSDEFRNAIEKVRNNPHESPIRRRSARPANRGFGSSASLNKQLTTSGKRILVPSDHPIRSRARSLPASIKTRSSARTLDSGENRFVKFALEQFADFLSRIGQKARGLTPPLTALSKEADTLKETIARTLNHDHFWKVSALDRAPHSSPVLQRRSGYREIYRSWVRFGLAANLTWEGGQDTYFAGQKKLSDLYEYWCFFRMLDLAGSVLGLDRKPLIDLIEKTRSGLALRLKAGSNVQITGRVCRTGRALQTRFDYNRTFTQDRPNGEAGSWTRTMRPDFTVTIWPDGISEREAEASMQAVHVHFDSKYRVNRPQDLFGDEDLDANQTKVEEKAGNYKRADLLKMHAYKDAIRRSYGAYVLYPGSRNAQDQTWTYYHEIVPGLGAFVLRPGDEGLGITSFLKDLVEHCSTAGSARETLANAHRAIYRP